MRLTFSKPIWSGWTFGVLLIAGLISTPVLGILATIFTDQGEVWQHLAETVLGTYIFNSFWLMVGVGLGVFIIGTGTAWLVTMCRFPGRKILEWALLLPLAAPAYVLAYAYTDFLEAGGIVQTAIRTVFQVEYGEYWFPQVRSLPGAIAMFILTLYPYVYLLTRVAFLEQSTCTLEASRSLGCNPWQSFIKIALPLARPAIAAGTALALMETLNDFGTVKYFSVDTFTTGIYRTWFGMGERVAATQLAATLLIFILILFWLERWSRQQAKYYESVSRFRALPGYKLKGIRSILAFGFCFLPIGLGFLLPGGILANMMLRNASEALDERFWEYARNTFIVASLASVLAAILAVIMAYGVRLHPSLLMKVSTRIAAMGYAIPGAAIAVGILIPIGAFDNALDQWMYTNFSISTGLLISGTIAALIFAYLVRFLAVALGSVESSLTKIKPNLDEASRSLGHSPTNTLVKVHAPLMGGGILTAIMLVFVDTVKELPATLIIRPFNFDTLAIRAYQLASDERLIAASGAALAVVLVGMIPVIFLSWKIAQARAVENH